MGLEKQVETAFLRAQKDGATQQQIANRFKIPNSHVANLLNHKRTFGGITLATFDRMFPNATISLDGEAQGVNVANSGLIANNHSSIHITTDGLKNAIINRILDLEGIPDDILARILKTIRSTEA